MAANLNILGYDCGLEIHKTFSHSNETAPLPTYNNASSDGDSSSEQSKQAHADKKMASWDTIPFLLVDASSLGLGSSYASNTRDSLSNSFTHEEQIIQPSESLLPSSDYLSSQQHHASTNSVLTEPYQSLWKSPSDTELSYDSFSDTSDSTIAVRTPTMLAATEQNGKDLSCCSDWIELSNAMFDLSDAMEESILTMDSITLSDHVTACDHTTNKSTLKCPAGAAEKSHSSLQSIEKLNRSMEDIGDDTSLQAHGRQRKCISKTAAPKVYECPHAGCSKIYSTRGHARRHSQTHQRLPPFKCPHETCKATFSRRDNCMHHQKRKHTLQKVPKRMCQQCWWS